MFLGTLFSNVIIIIIIIIIIIPQSNRPFFHSSLASMEKTWNPLRACESLICYSYLYTAKGNIP